MSDAAEPPTPHSKVTGRLIVFEGPDKSGKTTQSKLLEVSLKRADVLVARIAFPDRSTPVGQLIDRYLRGEIELNLEAVQLLFSANRWELDKHIVSLLEAGTIVILDRYVYSGWTYGIARGLDSEWAMHSDAGLHMPHIVLYMRADMDVIKSRLPAVMETTEDPAILKTVIELFDRLAATDTSVTWASFDASRDADIIAAQVQSALCANMWHAESPCTQTCFMQPWWAAR